MAAQAVESVASRLNPRGYRFGFELLGLDFMLDRDLKLYLIEVNTNPSLTIMSPVTGKVIASVLENTFK